MSYRRKAVELDDGLSPFLRPHRFFAADDVAGIDTTTDLIDGYSKTTNAAFINITPFYTFLRDLL